MRRRGISGQQTTEFALVIGIAVLAAISMELITRRSISRGVQGASDAIFGVPPVDDGRGKPKELDVKANQTVTEQGQPGFQRRTTTNESVKGHAVNEQVRWQIVPEPRPR